MSSTRVDDLMVGGDSDQSLEIACGTTVQLEIGGVEARLQAQFVGAQTGKFLIITTPGFSSMGGITVKLFTGNRVVVRYVYLGTVYGFETTIMEAISSPVRLIFLSYPRIINEQSVRADKRVVTKLPARLGAGEEDSGGMVTDISSKGCQFEIPVRSLPDDFNNKVDSEINLWLKLPGAAEEYEIGGQLKNYEKKSGTAKLGIAFAELDEQIQSAIDGYINLSQ